MSTPGVSHPSPTTAEDLRRVLDERAVQPVFQPVVDLDNRHVLGYEALARGPMGSAVESPAALFGAFTGATLDQGFLFGHPGPLPSPLPPPGDAIPLRPAQAAGADLAVDDPLRHEWDLVVIGPRFAAALVARDRGDGGPDDQRRFDMVVTHDRDLVIRAAEPLLRRLVPER